MPLEGKKIVLCVTGSVAAIESPKIARELRRQGAEVYSVMSKAAHQIIHPDVLHWATDREVVTKLDGRCQHVKLCGLVPEKADLILVAPCTANTLGKIAAGIDDTPVTTMVSTAFGSGIPIMVMPAMHYSLYIHPLVQKNIKKLEKLGVGFIPPKIEEKKAKYPGMKKVMAKVLEKFGQEKDLQGKKIMVTAGATREDLDEVRFISNKSSGKMGVALAEAAAARGAKVLLVKGSTEVEVKPLENLKTVEALSAGLMEKAIKKICPKADILIHCAAVSDFKARKAEGKISSRQGRMLRLLQTPKILEKVKQWNPNIFLVGFKAESQISDEALVGKALDKLAEAKADLIVANDVSRHGSVFGSDFNEVVLVGRTGRIKHLALEAKQSLAHKILDEIHAFQ